jgi:hypothetical protein
VPALLIGRGNQPLAFAREWPATFAAQAAHNVARTGVLRWREFQVPVTAEYPYFQALLGHLRPASSMSDALVGVPRGATPSPEYVPAARPEDAKADNVGALARMS